MNRLRLFFPLLAVAVVLAGCAIFPVPKDRIVTVVQLSQDIDEAHSHVARVLAERGFEVVTDFRILVSTAWFVIDLEDLDHWGDFGRSWRRHQIVEGAGRVVIALEAGNEGGSRVHIMAEYVGYWDEETDAASHRREVEAYSNGRLEREIAEAITSGP